MDVIAPICLADFAGIEGLALLAVGLVIYLWWVGVNEKRDQRRYREWLESRRREFRE